MFEDMRRPGAFAQALHKAAALTDAALVLDQRGQPRHQAVDETRQSVGRGVFEIADVDPGFQRRPVGPDVGPA